VISAENSKGINRPSPSAITTIRRTEKPNPVITGFRAVYRVYMRSGQSSPRLRGGSRSNNSPLHFGEKKSEDDSLIEESFASQARFGNFSHPKPSSKVCFSARSDGILGFPLERRAERGRTVTCNHDLRSLFDAILTARAASRSARNSQHLLVFLFRCAAGGDLVEERESEYVAWEIPLRCLFPRAKD
jgi:hypothetical protein